MGVGWDTSAGVDHLLLLHLEGSSLDWKGCVLHRPVPILPANNSADQR